MMEDRKSSLLLITELLSKREIFFKKAAEKLGISVKAVSWRDYRKFYHDIFENGDKKPVVKIDPPSYQTAYFYEMNKALDKYLAFLHDMQESSGVFLNSPDAIRELLNKKQCKLRLQECGISTTYMAACDVKSVDELFSILSEKHLHSVFVKPIWCSGAAGVVALRMHPHTKKLAAYTSCIIKDNVLINTKKIRYMTDDDKVKDILREVLKMGAIVERWVPKDDLDGKCYDLRVVCQFDRIEYVVVRQSDAPITNLHLNNQALSFEKFPLKKEQRQEIERLCLDAMQQFDGLRMAGIDILIEKNRKKPYIIEMNGQGDLIYQDIYNENRIYEEQVKWMIEKQHENGE